MSETQVYRAQGEALRELLDRVEALDRRGLTPVVVMDLDDTLFSTGQRHVRILREYAGQPQVRGRWLEAAWTLVQLEPHQLRYQITESAQSAGVTDPEVLQDLKSFWFERFFKNDYLLSDEPLPDAPEYCRALEKKGARLAYMTGRDEAMRQGTERSLERHGFPLTPGRDALILKPRFDTPDLAFKTEAIARLPELGTVCGAFENEPAHVNMFRDAFPDALMFFVDSKHSGKPIQPHPSARWIKDFRRALSRA